MKVFDDVTATVGGFVTSPRLARMWIMTTAASFIFLCHTGEITGG